MRIGTRLTLVFLLVSLVALGVTGFLAYHVASESLTQQILQHLESVAVIQSHRLENTVNQNMKELGLFSSRIMLRKALDNYLLSQNSEDQEEMNEVLTEARDATAAFLEMHILSQDGEVVASTSEGIIGSDYSNEEFFMGGLKERSGDIFFLDKDGNLRSYLTGPLDLGGKLLGVLVIESNAYDIVSIVQDYSGLGKTGETLLVRRDENGDVLFLGPLRFDENAALRRSVSKDDLGKPSVQALSDNALLLIDVTDYRGERVLAVTQYIEKTDWGLVVKIDEAEALATINNLRNLMILVFLVFSIMVVLVSIYSTRAITKPIINLTHVARAIAGGDLSLRAETKSSDEVGALAKSFNRMAGSLIRARTTLAKKVKERTAELEISKQQLEQELDERRKAEEALRESEERYRLHFENVFDVIFSVDTALRVLSVSPSVYRILGYEPDEIVGKRLQDLNMLMPDSLGAAVSHITRVLSGGRGMASEYEFVAKDGTVKISEISASPLVRDDKIVAVVAVARDITERRRTEAERRELEQKAQAASRLASVGEMAAGVAHEINNPLTSIIGYSQLLMKYDIPVELKKDLEIVADEAQRLADVVKRLLTFARQQKPMRDYVDVNGIIETTLALRAYHLRTSNIKVDTQLDPDLPITVADGGQLQQVFLNLIVNAEAEMRLERGRGKLWIKTVAADSCIRVSVRDDGPGISKENIQRIFDPFFTTREVGKGTGLGLSVCHGIIAEHNGAIYAESKSGKGATFVVELPIVTEKEQSVVSGPVSEEAQKATGAKILIVDDEPSITQFLSRVLADEGHYVDTAHDANEALRMIGSEKYSLVMLDIKMPGIGGIELLKRIKEISRPLAGRVVFITGDVMGLDTEKFLTETRARYITKPFDVNQLRSIINRMLGEVRRSR